MIKFTSQWRRVFLWRPSSLALCTLLHSCLLCAVHVLVIIYTSRGGVYFGVRAPYTKTQAALLRILFTASIPVSRIVVVVFQKLELFLSHRPVQGVGLCIGSFRIGLRLCTLIRVGIRVLLVGV